MAVDIVHKPSQTIWGHLEQNSRLASRFYFIKEIRKIYKGKCGPSVFFIFWKKYFRWFWSLELRSWTPDASLDNHIGRYWPLWPKWPFGHLANYGHFYDYGHLGHFCYNDHYSPIWVSKGASGLEERSPRLQNHLKYFFQRKNGKKCRTAFSPL